MVLISDAKLHFFFDIYKFFCIFARFFEFAHTNMDDGDIIMLFWLFKRFALLLLVAGVVAGITYLFYDSFHGTTDEVYKIDNYRTFAKDEVRYILASADPTAQQMIAYHPEDYNRFTSQMEAQLMNYQPYQPRHKKVLATMSKSKDTYTKQLSKRLLKNYRKTKINLTPFQEEGVYSIDEFDRLRIKMTKFNEYNYKSSNVVYSFVETNSGIQFKLTLGFICTCEADSADLARYSADLAE